jgi:Tfp pilus assembly protein PilF
MRDPRTALKEIAYAERFMGADPMKISGVSYLRGIARFQMSDYNGAKAELRKAVERDPNGICATLARKRLEQLGSAEDDQEIADSTVRSPF